MYRIYNLHVSIASQSCEAYLLLEKEMMHISDISEQSFSHVQKKYLYPKHEISSSKEVNDMYIYIYI